MYFSAKGEYGIMAVLDLALANGEAPVQAKTIAERQGIPLRFLEQILSALRHAGLVESSRGAHGGYRLAKPADKIRVGDVIQAVDGPIAMPTRRGNGNGHHTSHGSIVQGVWKEVKDNVLETLNRTTLADLCRRARDLEEQRALMYHI
ncbi:MAG TPA: Rrf2 family transcriptional regulator [Nitrospirales bacterium]